MIKRFSTIAASGRSSFSTFSWRDFPHLRISSCEFFRIFFKKFILNFIMAVFHFNYSTLLASLFPCECIPAVLCGTAGTIQGPWPPLGRISCGIREVCTFVRRSYEISQYSFYLLFQWLNKREAWILLRSVAGYRGVLARHLRESVIEVAQIELILHTRNKWHTQLSLFHLTPIDAVEEWMNHDVLYL